MSLSDVIFDMDGLLIDSEPLWMAAERGLAEDYGISVSEDELRAFQGTSSRSVCEQLARRYPQAGMDPEQMLQRLLQTMTQRIVEAPLLPGAEALVHCLAGQGIKLAVASSSPLAFIEAVVERHRLPLRILASGAEVPHSKPHPAVFLLAAERLGAEPGACWVWEDSVNGLIAARAAGMHVVAVPEVGHPHPQQFSIAHEIHRSLVDSLDWARSRLHR